MSTCAFVSCADADGCCLAGGCVVKKFPGMQPHEQRQRMLSAKAAAGLKENAPALNGTKAARSNAHPSTKKKSRKDLEWSGRK